MNYNFYNNRETSQLEAIPGRESEMKKSLSGGFAFNASIWSALERWLLTGSMEGGFYQGKEEMTKSNLETMEKCMMENPQAVGDLIVSASKLGVSVHTPIFALVKLSTGDYRCKDVFKNIFPSVIRTASHLYEFFSYVRNIRGFGKIIKSSSMSWILDKDVHQLEYQFLKYQNRYGFSGRDILRMIKPKTDDEIRSALFNWISGGSGKNPLLETFPEELERVRIYEKLKNGASETDVIEAIHNLGLTHEMIPANIERTSKIWEALFVEMPIGATIRNLGNLTNKKVFNSTKNLDILEEKFSEKRLKNGYIHPVSLVEALNVYIAGGTLGKSKLAWDYVPRVVDILEKGVESSFDFVEPTGKRFFHALDVSGSMTWSSSSGINLEPIKVAGVMALASVKSEKNYYVGGFSTNFIKLDINKNTSFKVVTDLRNGGIWPDSFGGTDASTAYTYAIKNNIETDVFVFWTDSESWAGRKHPSQALKEYREKINKNAKAIYVTLVPYGDKITLVDPKDKKSYDIAGFTSQTPKIIQMISKNEL